MGKRADVGYMIADVSSEKGETKGRGLEVGGALRLRLEAGNCGCEMWNTDYCSLLTAYY